MPKKITLQPDPKLKGKQYKRRTNITPAEKALIAQVVQESPFAVPDAQIGSLARGLRRKKEDIKKMIEEARENFVTSAQRYVEIHKAATEQALEKGDSEQALKGSQWALTNISAEGARIVDKVNNETNTPKVLVGIRIGGVSSNAPAITVDSE
jgi:ribosomal protein S9